MIKVYDKFLSEADFEVVSSFFLSSDIPWFFNNSIARGEEGLDGYQFVHSFCNVENPFSSDKSQYSKFITPIFNKLNPRYILRVKANLRPRTVEPFQSSWHTDTDIASKTCIFYINSNNGYTTFKDDTRVYSLENRLLLFDSHIEHSGVSCTNEKKRIVLNINYIPSSADGTEQLPVGEVAAF